MRVKFTVGNDSFIVNFGNEDVYYQWNHNFTHAELGKYGSFICDSNLVYHWLPYNSPFKCEVLE